MMDVKAEVGFCAGEVYGFLLKSGGEVPLMQVIKSIRKEEDLIIAAIGWLLREDKIDVSKQKDGMRVKLK